MNSSKHLTPWIVLALAVVTWAALRLGPAGPTLGHPGATAEGVDSSPGEVDALDGDSLDPGLDRGSPEAADGGTELRGGSRSAAPAVETPDGPSGARPFEVFLVDRASREPCVGAEVRVAGHRDSMAWRTEFESMATPDWEPVLASRVDPILSDDSGRVALDLDGQTYVVARFGDLYGSVLIRDHTESPLVLELDEDWELEVLVRRATGAMVPGIEVHVAPSDLQWRRLSDPVERGLTDDEGRWRLPHAQETLHGRPAYATLSLFLPHPLDPAPEAPWPTRKRGDGPRERITLEMPETGSLEIRLPKAPEGSTEEFPHARAWVAVVDPRRIEAGGVPGPTRTERTKLDGRIHVEPFVGLGLEFDIHAQWGMLAQPVVERVQGPSRAGERVVHELSAGAERVVLGGRVLDEDRRPRSGIAMDARLHPTVDERDLYDVHSFLTDGKGEFRIELPADSEGGAIRSLELVSLERGSPRVLERLRRALDIEAQVGEVDTGDWVLETAPVVASGQVRNGQGGLVEGATVEVSSRRRSPEGSKKKPGRFGRTRLGEFACDGEGRFEVAFFPEEDREYGLRAEAEGAPESDLRPILVGERGVVLVLEGGGALEGNFLLPDGFDARRLNLRVDHGGLEEDAWSTLNREHGDLGTPATLEGRRTHYERLSSDGSWRAEGLLLGEAQVRLMSDSGHTLFEQGGLRIRPGPAGEDGRLRDVDLRDELHSIRLSTVEPNGDPIRRVAIRVVGDPLAGTGTRTLLTNDHGHVQVLIVGREIDIEIAHPGRRVVRRKGIREDTEIVLDPGIPLEFMLPGSLELPEPPLFLELTGMWIFDGSTPPELRRDQGQLPTLRFEGTRSRVLHLPVPGRVQPRLGLVRRIQGRVVASRPQDLVRTGPIDVGEGGAGPVTLDVDLETYREHLDELRGD